MSVNDEQGRPILVGIDWSVGPLQRWAVLGPNGAGKSTLLHIGSTYRFPTRGTVDILGERAGTVDIWHLRRRIGYASAELERMVDRRMSALDTVLTGKGPLLRRWHEAFDDADVGRATELLSDLGLRGMERRIVATLSEGERRRVHIARALMPAPDVLLLDEPAAGLDVAGREHLLTVLQGLAATDILAIVFVTHHVEEIPPGFTHALLLRDGAVSAVGPIHEALTDASMSACFGLPLELAHEDGRFRVRAHRTPPPDH